MNDQWTLLKTQPDEYTQPFEAIEQNGWIDAIVPGTVAQTLEKQNIWSLDDNVNYDDYDWWYQATIANKKNAFSRIKFHGLATSANVWLNDHLILAADNMFLEYDIDVKEYLQETNNLVIQFKSINALSKSIRNRPRWKTKLVKNQKLNHIRTSLVGRIPGWTPQVAPIGPWKEIEYLSDDEPLNLIKNVIMRDEVGIVELIVEFPSYSNVESVEYHIHGITYKLKKQIKDNEIVFSDNIEIKNPTPWWPHTHGEPFCYSNHLKIKTSDKIYTKDLSPVGFKTVVLDQNNNNFYLSVNDNQIFCRGACWTINDVISLTGDIEKLRHKLVLLKKAGGNMIRVIGTMCYEQDAFYQICDELGIMVWQDFMFANMDYPFENEDFLINVQNEVSFQVKRLSNHPSVTIFCGNSEIQQQIAMLGFERGMLKSDFFDSFIPEHLSNHQTELPYVSSSPSGGDQPFRTHQGLSHYYGLGAYLRPLSEIRRHDVRFTSECLGFANIPCSETRNKVLDGQLPTTHDPQWKRNTPRDTGTGWDFEDVRDHYLEIIYKLNARELRSHDPERYLKLSELVSGHVMKHAFDEWRSTFSNCSGGLLWFYNDLTPGAGWGIIDSEGIPKAAYYALKQAWQPISIHITDESINGLFAHLTNETNERLNGQLKIELLDSLGTVVYTYEDEILVDAKSKVTIDVEKQISHFRDINYTYRFGAPIHNSVRVSLLHDNHIAQSTYTLSYKDINLASVNDIEANLSINGEIISLTLNALRYVHGVSIDCKGYLPDDNYFDMFAGDERVIDLHKLNNEQRLRCYIGASNIIGTHKLTE